MNEPARSTLKRLLPKGTFARGVSLLAGGTASAQLVQILFLPLLTRLFSPENFGALAIYSALLALMCMVACLRYELAIPLPQGEADAASVVALSLLVLVITTTLTAVMLAMFSEGIVQVLGVPELANLLWLLPAGVFLGGAFTVLRYWLVRAGGYGAIAGARLKQSVVSILVQVSCFKLGGMALVVGQAAGQLVGTASLTNSLKKKLRELKSVSRRSVYSAAKRYRRFPAYSTWEGIFSQASLLVAPLFFAAAFSPAAAGLYALTFRVFSMPVSLVSGAVSSVLLGHAAETKREQGDKIEVLPLYTKLAHLGLPGFLIVATCAPTLFTILFGEQWEVSGQLARWVAVWLFFQFIAAPMSVVFTVYERQKEGLLWQASLLVMRILAVLGGMLLDSLIWTVALFSLLSALHYLLVLLRIGVITGARVVDFFEPTFKAAGVAALCSSPIAFFHAVGDGSITQELLAFSVSAALALLRLLMLTGRSY